MRILYNISIELFTILIRIVAIFNNKAALWVKGRKGWEEMLLQKVESGASYIWLHAASLGEFEQGRPVIEELKRLYPERKVLLTFYSPSGYEVRKNYQGADIVFYLPADTPQNAKRFVETVKPVIAVFVKYEFWYNYVNELKKRDIPVYLISGIFRKEQHFFHWYGSFFRAILEKFDWMYLQDQNSFDLIKGLGLERASIAGDTRFDRVVEIARSAKELPVIESFGNGEKIFLAGSSWKGDEEIIAEYIKRNGSRLKWIFAPHEVERPNIERLAKLISAECVLYSQYTEDQKEARVLIIDNIGILSSAYRYASIAGIGGGFGKGIHNILEAACWGVPVMFGPNYGRFREATDMLAAGGAFSYSNYDEFEKQLDLWLNDSNILESSALAARKYVEHNAGATHKIVEGMRFSDINKGYS